MMNEIYSLALDDNSKASQLGDGTGIAAKLVYSLGDEFCAEYMSFRTEIKEFLSYHLQSPTLSVNTVRDLEARIAKSAGKLHIMMNEKLISIRDT